MKIQQTDNFEEFPFDKQCELVKQSPVCEKGELILRSQYPEEIIQQMGPENFYFIARSTDREMLPELLSFADTDQLLFYTDFYCFEYDKINHNKFTSWIRYLLKASEEQFLNWVQEMDFDFIISAYKKILRIIKSTPEEVMDEILQDEQYFTIDFLYHIFIKNTDDFLTIKKSLEILFECKKSLYFNLMECVISEITAETEEEAFLSHQERLSESGFPEKNTAMNIYTPMTSDEWQNLEKKMEKDISLNLENNILIMGSEYITPSIPSGSRLFIDDVFAFISGKDPMLKNEIDLEIMALTNKILALSMNKDYDLDEMLLKNALNEVKGTLNIALIDLSLTHIQRSAEFLSEYWLEHIFRQGFSQIVIFRKKAHALLKKINPVNQEALFHFFDTEYECTLRGLLQLSPHFYSEETTENLYNLREFRTPDDLKQTAKRLEHIEKMFDLFGHLKQFNDLFDAYLPLNMPIKEITIYAVIFTAFANYTLSGSFSAYPLGKMELQDFLSHVFHRTQDNRNCLKMNIKKKFFDFFKQSFHDNARSLLPIIENSLARGEEEMHSLDLSKDPDPRFIRSLCFLVEK